MLPPVSRKAVFGLYFLQGFGYFATHRSYHYPDCEETIKGLENATRRSVGSCRYCGGRLAATRKRYNVSNSEFQIYLLQQKLDILRKAFFNAVKSTFAMPALNPNPCEKTKRSESFTQIDCL